MGYNSSRDGAYIVAILSNLHKVVDSTNRLELVYNFIGATFDSVGNEKDALMYDFRSLKIARELNDTSGESGDINNIASIYQNEDNYKKALHYFKKSLALSRTKKEKAMVYGNIGTVYSDMNNYAEAINYTTKALNLSESIGNYYVAAQDYLNLGDNYIYVKNYPTAQRYILKGISMEKKIGNNDWIGTGYQYLGRLYGKEGDNKKALLYYSKAYDMFKISGDTSDMQVCLSMINKIKNKK